MVKVLLSPVLITGQYRLPFSFKNISICKSTDVDKFTGITFICTDTHIRTQTYIYIYIYILIIIYNIVRIKLNMTTWKQKYAKEVLFVNIKHSK